MRHTLSYRAALAVGAGLITVGFPATRLLGYATSGQGWATNQVVFYVNPQSFWVSPSQATSALRSAADAWTQQTSANVQLVYGGPTSGSTMQMNGRNEVFFRNDTSGALAETYRWRDGSGNLVDADIVFHENYPYYAFSGCVDSGVYVEDVAIHEFGHALGLAHSGTAGATMYPSIPSWCDTSQESLDPDDIAGIEALYPPAQVPATPENSAPAVSIATPYANSSYPAASSISFSGSANDTSDGNVSTKLVWTSSLDGQIGTGASFSKTLSAGTHTITAWTTDAFGLTGSAQVTVTVGSSQSSGASPSLSATSYKVKRSQRVDLTWSGLVGGSVDLYRNGNKLTTTPNDGAQTDTFNAKGIATSFYKVCEAGTTTCSPEVSVTF